MCRFACWLALSFVVTSAANAAAERTATAFFTASDLLESCISESAGAREICHGYIEGVADLYEAGRAEHGVAPCRPEKTEVIELVHVTADFIAVHKDAWNKDASTVIASALSHKWNCKYQPRTFR